MRRRNKSEGRGWLFITGSTHRRIPLFRTIHNCNVFLENLAFYRKKYKLEIGGYVILPDHYHLLIKVPPEVSLEDLLRDFKSSIGRQIVDLLKKTNKNRVLQRLAVPQPRRRRKDALYKVLQADNYIKRVVSDAFYYQKLDYIHLNPVREGLVKNALEYPYSSARWYTDEGVEERTQWLGPLG